MEFRIHVLPFSARFSSTSPFQSLSDSPSLQGIEGKKIHIIDGDIGDKSDEALWLYFLGTLGALGAALGAAYVVSGKTDAGSGSSVRIIHLRQIHRAAMDMGSLEILCGIETVDAILQSQLKVAEVLQENLNTPVFIEGRSDLDGDFLGELPRLKKMAGGIFKKGLPPPDEVHRLSPTQRDFLYSYGGPNILFFLGKIQIFPAEDPTILDKAFDMRHSDSWWARHHVFWKREISAALKMKEFLDKTGGREAIIVFGAGHDFSKAVRRVGASLENIDCTEGFDASTEGTTSILEPALSAKECVEKYLGPIEDFFEFIKLRGGQVSAGELSYFQPKVNTQVIEALLKEGVLASSGERIGQRQFELGERLLAEYPDRVFPSERAELEKLRLKIADTPPKPSVRQGVLENLTQRSITEFLDWMIEKGGRVTSRDMRSLAIPDPSLPKPDMLEFLLETSGLFDRFSPLDGVNREYALSGVFKKELLGMSEPDLAQNLAAKAWHDLHVHAKQGEWTRTIRLLEVFKAHQGRVSLKELLGTFGGSEAYQTIHRLIQSGFLAPIPTPGALQHFMPGPRLWVKITERLGEKERAFEFSSAQLQAKKPNPSDFDRLEAPFSEKRNLYGRLTEKQYQDVLRLQKTQSLYWIQTAESLHQWLLDNRDRTHTREYSQIKSEVEALAAHFLEMKNSGGERVTHFTDSNYCGRKIYGDERVTSELKVQFNDPLASSPLKALFESIKKILRSFTPGIVGGAVAAGVTSLGDHHNWGSVTTDIASVLSAGFATGIAGLGVGLSAPVSASYAAWVLSAHAIDALSRYESHFLNSAEPLSSPWNASIRLGIGSGQIVNDLFALVFGGIIEGGKGFCLGLLERPKEVNIFIPATVKGLVKGFVESTTQSLGDLLTHVIKVAESTRDLSVPLFEVVGKETLDLGNETAEIPKPAAEPIPSVAPAPVWMPPVFNLPPVFPPTPMTNFTQHLWINTIRQQDPFSVSLRSLTTPSSSLVSSPAYQSYQWIQSRQPERPSLFDSRAVDSIDRHMVRSSFEDSVHYGDSFREAFDRANRTLGYPRGFDYDRFVALLRATGLVPSYKNIHPWARVSSYGLRGEIGGVAAQVGLIKGFEHSPMHLNALPRFVLPVDGAMPFSDLALQQILRELAQAIFIHEALPFFSLHFQPNKSLSVAKMTHQFSVIHPAYQQTLVGLTIAILDFWMKGFLNGGTYSDEFLKSWAKAPNFDEAYLKAHWIDLQKEAHAEGISYKSFREKCFEAGLGEFGKADDGLKFTVSFRILSHQKEAKFDEKQGIFLLQPFSFRVEYTIHPKPEYAEELKRYRAEQGKYPEDYQKFEALCLLQAKEIQEVMPKFSRFRPYFYQLDVITFLSHYFHNLKQVGLQPSFSPINRTVDAFCPEIFPTFPMRYFKLHSVQVSLEEIFFPKDGPEEFLPSALLTNLSKALEPQISSEVLADNPGLMTKIQSKIQPMAEKKIEELKAALEKEILITLEKIMKEAGLWPFMRGSLSLLDYLKRAEKVLLEKLKGDLEDSLKEKQKELSQLMDQERESCKKSALESIKVLTQEFARIRDQEIASFHQQWKAISAEDQALSVNQTRYKKALADTRQEYTVRVATITKGIDAGLKEELLKIQKVQVVAEENFREQMKQAEAELASDPWVVGIQALQHSLQHPFERDSWDHAVLEQFICPARIFLSTFEIPKESQHLKLFGGCGLDFSPIALNAVNLSSDLNVGKVFKSFSQNGKSYAGFALGVDASPVLSPLSYEKLSNVFLEEPSSVRLPIHSGEAAGLNPLFLALYENNPEAALRALEENPTMDVSAKIEKDITALHLAIELGMEKVAEVLISRGADLTAKRESDGFSPWHLAAEKGQASLVQTMARSGRVDPAVETPQGESALFLAIRTGSMETFQFLLTLPAINPNSVNAKGRSPTHEALYQGQTEMALYLIRHSKVKPERSDVLAAELQEWRVVEALKDKGGIFSLPDAELRREIVRQGKILWPLSRLALSERQKLFELAVASSQPMMARQLAKGGLSPAFTHQGWIQLDHLEPEMLSRSTPEDLYLAARSRSKKVFYALADALKKQGKMGASEVFLPEGDSEGVSECDSHVDPKKLMLFVMEGGRTSLIRWMLSQYPLLANAELEEHSTRFRGDHHGHVTPISIAAELNRIDWVEMLLRAGADFHEVIEHAEFHRSLPLIKALVRWAKAWQGIGEKDYLGKVEFWLARSLLGTAIRGNPEPLETLLALHPLKDFSVYKAGMSGGGDWNTKNNLLQIAIENAAFDWIDRLVEAGAELNIKSPAPTYSFPLQTARFKNDRKLVAHLLDKGADPRVTLCESYPEKLPVSFVDSVARTGQENIRELLIERGLLAPEDRRHERYPDLTVFKAKKARILKALATHDEKAFERELKFFDLGCSSMVHWDGVGFGETSPEPLVYWIGHYRAHWALPILAKDHDYGATYKVGAETRKLYSNQMNQLGILDSAGNSFLHHLLMWPEEDAKRGWETLKAAAYQVEEYFKYRGWKGGIGRGISHCLFMQPNKAGVSPVDLAFIQGWRWLLQDPVFYAREERNYRESKDYQTFKSGRGGKTILHQAVANGDLSLVRYYGEQIPDEINRADVYGRTPLMRAAEIGNLAMVQCLLDLGADPRLVDRDRRNLMHFAGSKDTPEHEALFSELICIMPLPVLRQKSDLEGTPLFVGVQRGWARSADRLETLLGSRELFRKRRDGLFLLHCCVMSKYPPTSAMEKLFDHILSLFKVQKGGVDVVPQPKHPGFVLNKDLTRLTPLMLAGQLGRTTWFQGLLENGADPLKKVKGIDALGRAVAANTLEMTRLICTLPAVQERDQAIRIWFMAVLSANRVMLEQLLLSGFFINQKDEGIGHGDENSLHYAARSGHTAITVFLLAGGIDRHLKNRLGESARDLADKAGHFGVVKVIEEAGHVVG